LVWLEESLVLSFFFGRPASAGGEGSDCLSSRDVEGVRAGGPSKLKKKKINSMGARRACAAPVVDVPCADTSTGMIRPKIETRK